MAKLKYLNAATFVLKWAVLYPIDKKTPWKFKFLYFIWSVLYLTSFGTTIIQCVGYLYLMPFDIIEEASVVMNTVIYTFLFIKFFVFSYNSEGLVNFVESINRNFVESTDNEIEHITMEKASQISDKILYYYLPSIIFAALAPMITTLFTLADGRREVPIQGWFPYDPIASPKFEISCSWQTFVLFNLGLMYGTTDVIYLCITNLMAQQFKILSNNLKNNLFYSLLKSGINKNDVISFSTLLKNHDLFELIKSHKAIFTVMETEEFKQINLNYLKKNIKHHKLLLDYCDDINDTLSTFLLTTVATSTFNFIFQFFTIINTGNESNVLVLYFFFATFELLIYTYSGQILTQSADILWELYDCPWYLCDTKFQKILLMVQIKLFKIVETKAGNYFSMTAPSFISFVRAGCSYIAVLRKVTERKNK